MRLKLLKNMGVDRTLIKSVGMVSVGNIIYQGIAFIVLLFLAWILSKEEYGYIRYVIQIGNFIVMFIAAGFASALTRFTAAYKKDANKYFTSALVVILISFLVLLLIFLIFQIDVLIYMVVIGYSIPLIYYGVIRGFIDYKKIASFNILRAVIKIVLIGLIFFFEFLKMATYIIGVYAFGAWIAILLIEIFNRTDVHLDFRGIKKKIILHLARFSMFSVLSNVFYSSLLTVGYLLLEQNYGYTAVADYSMAVAIGIIYTFLPGAVNTLLMPKVASGSYNSNLHRLKQAILLNTVYIILLYVLVVIFGKWGLELLFGNKYINSYYILIILSIGYIFRGTETAFGAFWGGVNKPEYAATSVGVAAGVNLILSYYLIKAIGKMGVPWAYTIALASTVIVNFALYKRHKKLMTQIKE